MTSCRNMRKTAYETLKYENNNAKNFHINSSHSTIPILVPMSVMDTLGTGVYVVINLHPSLASILHCFFHCRKRF